MDDKIESGKYEAATTKRDIYIKFISSNLKIEKILHITQSQKSLKKVANRTGLS